MKRKISSVNQLNSRMVPLLWSFHCLIVRNPQYAARRRNPFMRFVLLEAFLAEVPIFFFSTTTDLKQKSGTVSISFLFSIYNLT